MSAISFEALPNEVLENVAAHLSFLRLKNLSLVNKRLRAITVSCIRSRQVYWQMLI